ncbi:S8 family serine peptidase [Parabacteroides sp. PF5-9]|uniref:S8 family peptidase n=1 Tax=Parabacteroides sp. PF5-9 TaxID=1742404 RepID=UPI002474734C|nr:S8 family serine peptidase [Parabacteroides sp. PF5-9]MDH6356741.1 subtilisin family serine protease [Parabacteroides sp. PF5-9]
MNRSQIILLLLCFLGSFQLLGGESFCFRVYLKDKGNSGYSIDHPEEFLSQEAIERRLRQEKGVDVSDLPIAEAYLDALREIGCEPVTQSKWLQTVVVATSDSLLSERLTDLSIVDSVKWIWKGEREHLTDNRHDTSVIEPQTEPIKAYYGYAEAQIKMLNGIKLHQKGYTGEGMRVAVIDAGFKNVDRISLFDSLRILGTRNIVFPGENVFFGDDHGTKVLSCMAINQPGMMVGTAPLASYLLIKSEDIRSEYPVEEDYWAAAVEYADSAGVDVITSSLGYFRFDTEGLNYTYEDLNGQTAVSSRIASMAAEKGILLFSSAGNEGNGSWEKITVPSDVADILTVGSITSDKKRSGFSSMGPTADGRVKPDVVALGSSSCVVDATGDIRQASGTSFATPILAGLGVCLWQACPELSNLELIELIRHVSSQYRRPDIELGYGIPDMYKAYKLHRKNASRH